MSWSLVTHLKDDHSPISRTLVPDLAGSLLPMSPASFVTHVSGLYPFLRARSIALFPPALPIRSTTNFCFFPIPDTPLPTPVPTLSWFSLFSLNPAPAPPPISCSFPWCHLPDPSPQWLGERGRADGTSYLGLTALLGWRGRGANFAGLRDLPCPQACHWPCPQSCPPGRAPSGAPQNTGPSEFRSLVRADQDAVFCGVLVLVHVDQNNIVGKVVVGPRGPTRGFS